MWAAGGFSGVRPHCLVADTPRIMGLGEPKNSARNPEITLKQLSSRQQTCFMFPIAAMIGAACAWVWWSFSVPRWRKWALEEGTPADQLQKWEVATGLVWPKGWIFEKTEFKAD